MIYLNLSFIVSNPSLLKKDYSYFDIGRNHTYFEEEQNLEILNHIVEECYLPANYILNEAIQKHPQHCQLSFVVGLDLMEQLALHRQDAFSSFQTLLSQKNIELLGSTGYNTLASLYSESEFSAQVKHYQQFVKATFGKKPKVFLNSELIYSNHIGDMLHDLGYEGVITEGTETVLGWRSPDFVYNSKAQFKQKILLRNYKLSDAIIFRFSDVHWQEYPLTAEKFLHWIMSRKSHHHEHQVLNLVIDYETFGYYQGLHTQILSFLSSFIEIAATSKDVTLATPGEICKLLDPISSLNIDSVISWAGEEKTSYAWTGNDLQQSSLDFLYQIGKEIKKSKNNRAIHVWRILQHADYIRFMTTWETDYTVHMHTHNNFSAPEDAFITYNNILKDLLQSV